MSEHTTTFNLPDTLANWPWPRMLNPHYQTAKVASSAWTESFNAFRPKAQKAFNLCDFNLLASLAFPLADEARCRTACDLMNLFFVFDEYSDIADEGTVRQQADIIMDALRNPHKPRPKGECIIGEITRQFWERAVETASPSSQRRFIETFDAYTASVVQQAEDRTHSYIRSIDSYLAVRRDTIGAKPSFTVMEMDMDLPDEVLHDPAVANLTLWCIDMLILGNDICSYNVEQARGDDGHNILTIAQHELKADLNGALKWVKEYHDELVTKFLENVDKVPSFGPELDPQVARYVDGLGNWVRANDQWSFESQRYFGTKGLEIMKHRTVALLPKVSERPDAAQPSVLPMLTSKASEVSPFPMLSVCLCAIVGYLIRALVFL
ncbi:hypothetical protein CERSUDRAFT_161387 [Gelatoporia subvermispora B]|uniref:Terpene synthase n=1 Tax=Ceriporiopsis subvermispora (strain B) TaxID=914234 RepID=M2QL39_CERS8|nr:hypothetical protein CERSUDRAFT_161387 [Gelatoporia subvermispora B]